MSDHIQYDFLYDNHFAELKESELLTNRLTNLAQIEPYIGKFYSNEYVRRKILQQTDSEIIEIDDQIRDEIEKGIIPNPATIDPITGEPLPAQEVAATADQNLLGNVPQEPGIDGAATQVPEPNNPQI